MQMLRQQNPSISDRLGLVGKASKWLSENRSYVKHSAICGFINGFFLLFWSIIGMDLFQVIVYGIFMGIIAVVMEKWA